MGLIPQDAVPYIIVVGHLHLVEENHILQLRGISHHRSFSHNGIAPHKGTVTDFSILIYNQRSVQTGCGSHLCVFCNPDVLAALFINISRKLFTQTDDKVVDFGQNLPGIFYTREQFCGNGFL